MSNIFSREATLELALRVWICYIRCGYATLGVDMLRHGVDMVKLGVDMLKKVGICLSHYFIKRYI